MGRYDWLDNLEVKKYIMPFVIDKDNEYEYALKEKFDFICDDLKKQVLMKSLLIIHRIYVAGL